MQFLLGKPKKEHHVFLNTLEHDMGGNCVPGKPKGIVRPTGGHIATLAWTMSSIYDMKEGDVWWTASDMGWVVGHSYICYGPLCAGLTSVMYEGKPDRTPDPGQWFR